MSFLNNFLEEYYICPKCGEIMQVYLEDVYGLVNDGDDVHVDRSETHKFVGCSRCLDQWDLDELDDNEKPKEYISKEVVVYT